MVFDLKYTKKTVKHNGGNIMIWGCFFGYSVGTSRLIQGYMDRNQYKQILEEYMLPYADDNLPVIRTFQHDKDTTAISKYYFAFKSPLVLNV